MKREVMSLFVVFVLVMSLSSVSAVWWNPFTWFDEPRLGPDDCSIDQTILKLSDDENAHGSTFESDYSVSINYNNIFSTCYTGNNPHVCNGENLVLRLSDENDAHASVSNENYPVEICYGNLNCEVRESANGENPCLENEESVLSISDRNNAHLALGFDEDSYYELNVCCSIGEIPQGNVCGDGNWDETTEECDDGNTENGDGCSATCELENVCGNGVIERPNDEGMFEQCDTEALDGFTCDNLEELLPECVDICVDSSCNDQCLVEFDLGDQQCGDGVLDSCELCEINEDGDDLFPENDLTCADFGYTGCEIVLNECTTTCTPNLSACSQCPSTDLCGNDIIDRIDEDGDGEYEYMEECDGDNLDDWTCRDFGYAEDGALSCNNECEFDFAFCEGDLPEICDNGRDDNDDGLIDCLDPLCEEAEICETPCDEACTDAAICHPRETEVCGNDLDDDCNGETDEMCAADGSCIGESNNICEEGEGCLCSDCHGEQASECSQNLVCSYETDSCQPCPAGTNFEPVTKLCVPKVFNIKIVQPDTLEELFEKRFVVNDAIIFDQTSENNRKDISIEWNFEDGSEPTVIADCLTTGNCDTTHSYETFGHYIVTALASEQGGTNTEMNFTELLVYREGINVFAIISEPMPGELIEANGAPIDFNASTSFVSECFTDTTECDTASDDCYEVTGSSSLYCYDLSKAPTVLGEEYDLLFNWTFIKGDDYKVSHVGTWSENYSTAVDFKRSFLVEGNYTAELTVTYGEAI